MLHSRCTAVLEEAVQPVDELMTDLARVLVQYCTTVSALPPCICCINTSILMMACWFARKRMHQGILGGWRRRLGGSA